MENNENLNNHVNKNNNVVQEKKNNNKTIGIVVLVIGLLLVCFAGYKLFIEKPKTDQPKNNNTQETENTNSYSSNLDLSKIETKSFEVTKFNPEKLEEIQKEKIFELEDENIATLSVSVDDTKTTIKYNSNTKSITKEFNNTSKVFYSNYGICSPHTLVYVISNEKIYLVNIDNYASIYEETLTDSNFVKEIDNSNNYDGIYMAYLHPATCDFIPLWLGHTADGKYYDLATNTEYEENTYFYYDDGYNYVKKDKTYKLGNYSGKIKIGFINIFSEVLDAFIDENEYFYEMDYELNTYKLVSNEKIAEVKQEEDKLKLAFSDGKKIEIELDYLEAYK